MPRNTSVPVAEEPLWSGSTPNPRWNPRFRHVCAMVKAPNHYRVLHHSDEEKHAVYDADNRELAVVWGARCYWVYGTWVVFSAYQHDESGEIVEEEDEY